MSATALREQLVHGAANLVVGFGNALGVEIFADLAEDIVVAGLFEVRHDDRFGIGVGVRAGHAELSGRPQPQHLVAPGRRLEAQLLVVGELLLEAFLALVERGHSCLSVSGMASTIPHDSRAVFSAECFG